MHLALWLDEAAAEHKANGTRAFASAAIYDLFVLTVDEDEHKKARQLRQICENDEEEVDGGPQGTDALP